MANILNSRSSHTALLDSYLDRGCALAFTSADVNKGEDVDITTLLGSVTLKDSAYEFQCHTPFGKGRLQGAEEGVFQEWMLFTPARSAGVPCSCLS